MIMMVDLQFLGDEFRARAFLSCRAIVSVTIHCQFTSNGVYNNQNQLEWKKDF